MQASNGRQAMVQGRIVWTSGPLFKGKPKVDMNTKQPRLDKTGQPMTEYGFGLAVPKSALGPGGAGHELWNAIHAEAATMFPAGSQIPPSFAMKYKDGDGIDHMGRPFAEREGHAGHLIFSCTTTIPIKFFKWENGANIMISEGIKCGDYVNVQLQIKAHPGQGTAKAGLYLNPNAVQFLGFGKEIINQPDGDDIFGTGAPPMPAGASAVPLAPQGATPLVPGGPAYTPPPAGYQPPPAAPPAPVTPHYGVLPPVHQPPPGGVPTAPPPMGQYPPTAAPVYQPPAAVPTYPGMPAVPGYPQQ